MQHVAENMTNYLRAKLETKPDGIDVKDVSYDNDKYQLKLTHFPTPIAGQSFHR